MVGGSSSGLVGHHAGVLGWVVHHAIAKRPGVTGWRVRSHGAARTGVAAVWGWSERGHGAGVGAREASTRVGAREATGLVTKGATRLVGVGCYGVCYTIVCNLTRAASAASSSAVLAVARDEVAAF